MDDNYVQKSTGQAIYLGDSVEVLLDTSVQTDYWYQALNWDDFQIGISPGNPDIGTNPEAYIWYPWSIDGPTSEVTFGVKPNTGGYRVTIAIPWSLLDVEPYEGMHLGFAASVSDDDSGTGGKQQSMVSSTSARVLTDPTTWGDLILVK